MILDSSAVLAIMLEEPECDRFIELAGSDSRCAMSAATVLEASMVLESRKGQDARGDLDVFLARAGVAIVPFDSEQLLFARVGFLKYGKGRHPAALNFGDCIAYALAKWSGEPLLFKGTDFAATDVRRVEA